MAQLAARRISVTWKVLHENVFNRLNTENGIPGLNEFLDVMIPAEFLAKLCGTSDGKVTKQYKGYVYPAKPEAANRFSRAQSYIIGRKTASGEAFRYDTLPLIRVFQCIWEEKLPQTRCLLSDQNASEGLKSAITELLASIPDEALYIRHRLTALSEKKPCSMVLAVLSVIASTLFCFREPFQDEDLLLHAIVLPPVPKMEASDSIQTARAMISDSQISFGDLLNRLTPLLDSHTEKGEAAYLLYQKAMAEGKRRLAEDCLLESVRAGYLPAVQANQQNRAQKYVEEIRQVYITYQHILEDKQYSEEEKYTIQSLITAPCGKCEDSLRYAPFISKETCGEAAFYLYYFIHKGFYTSVKGEAAEGFLRTSYLYGYQEAIKPWEAGQLYSQSIAPDITVAECDTVGVCCANTDNRYTRVFRESLPAGWRLENLDLEELERTICLPVNRRVLLLDADFSRNLEQLCQILQAVKAKNPEPKNLHLEIFIRHNSESVHALIDTALARLPGYQIPVYILNDAKIAAQQLLSQHPLFYPVRALKLEPAEDPVQQRPLLHFVVLGTSDAAQWLVREAFWMMGFRGNAIRAKITVLAKDGEHFNVELKSRFPGMASGEVRIRGIEMPEVVGKDIDLDSRALAAEIQKISEETPYCYFAVAEDSSDDRNLTLATCVREALIRAAIRSGKSAQLYEMPPVAFLCRNDQIAWLTRGMVVEKEEFGDRWYNTRALIPFGQISERYTFNSITGGTFGQLAKCIHFQYGQITPQAVLEQAREAINSEKDYFSRQYNQDSSYSMALSMPYRLFQFRERDAVQIYPVIWNILDKSTFCSAEQLRLLAQRIRIDDDRTVQELGEWEHARWARWMLSRGWMPASPEEAVFSHRQGNPRQQLFAARLHPCICAYEELRDLADILLKQCNLKKDFYSYDQENIKDTRKLLDLEWIIPKQSQTEPDTKR